MHGDIITPRSVFVLLVMAVLGLRPSSVPAQMANVSKSKALETASHVVRFSGSSGGIGVVVGGVDAEIAMALAGQGRFVVHCLSTEPNLCDRMRQVFR